MGKRVAGKKCRTPGCRGAIRRLVASGRTPEYCPACRSAKSNARRDRRTAERRGDAELAAALSPVSTAASNTELSKIQRMAVALSATENLAEAAELAGVRGTGPELTALAARARAEHPELVAGRLAGLSALSSQVLAFLMVRLRDEALELPASLVASSLKSAADVAERLLGGVAPTFSTINVTLDLGPDDDGEPE